MSWQSCPKCNFSKISIIDTRWKPEVPGVYRRLWCLNRNCQHRFSTLERIIRVRSGTSIRSKLEQEEKRR